MSDNLRRYRAIRDAFTQCYPGQPSGTVARHLITLAALISGIVGSKNTPLPHIAAQVPNGTQPESRVKRFARWLDNAHSLEEVYFLPYADVLLRHLALQTLVLVMDGSGVGRGCTALMIHGIYKGRALSGPGGCAKPRKGTFPKSSLSPWSNSSAGSSPRGRRGCCWAMGHSMGRDCSKRCRMRAGPTRAARPRALWHRGRASPFASMR
jgi:hypothetical protein